MKLLVEVETGDTLSHIAERYLGNWNRWMEIARLNKLVNPHLIFPKQQLVLPAR